MMKKTITFGQWSTQVSQMMTKECFKIIVKQSPQGDIVRYVSKEFLYNFIGSLAQQTLEEVPAKENVSDEELEEYININFSTLKHQIQDAVSSAFGDAMSDFTGHNVEYYCQIKIVDETANKRPI